jgi:hypothetical protein
MRTALVAMLLGGSFAATAVSPAMAQAVRGSEGGDRAWHAARPAYTVAFTGMDGGAEGPDHDNPWSMPPEPGRESPGR